MKDVLGILMFGFGIGIISGLSESAIVTTLIAALFAFSGGSLLSLMRGADGKRLEGVGAVLGMFSAGLISGMVLGVLIRGHDLFHLRSPEPRVVTIKDVVESRLHEVDARVVARLFRDHFRLAAPTIGDLATIAEAKQIKPEQWMAIISTSTGGEKKQQSYLILGSDLPSKTQLENWE